MTAATYTAKVGFTVPANCKVMALCDDTVETVVGGNLLQSSDFSASTGWTEYLNGSTGGSTSIAAGVLTITQGSNSVWMGRYQSFTTVVGKNYVAYANLKTTSAPMASRLSIGTSASIGDGASGIAYGERATNEGTFFVRFTATTTTTYIALLSGAAATINCTFDDCYVAVRDDDISAQTHDLMVYGSITKAVTATNATTVAYSGFSASNYLYQPYNSDLDFGTADFQISAWFKVTTSGTDKVLMQRGYYSGAWSGPSIEVFKTSTDILRMVITDDGYVTYDETSSTSNIADEAWHHVHAQRVSGSIYIYIDGALEDTSTITNAAGSLSNSSGFLTVGTQTPGGGVYFNGGSIAGFRIGTGSLTASQIKTIYDDEKHLFKPESLFTVVGDSYDVDIPTTGHARSRNIVKSSQKSLSGRVESVKSREEVTYDVTTPPLAIAKLVEVRSLLRNVDNGETFFFDAKGSVASEYDLQECVLESESESESQANEDYQSTSFTVRVL